MGMCMVQAHQAGSHRPGPLRYIVSLLAHAHMLRHALLPSGSIHITTALVLPVLQGAIKLDVQGLQGACQSFVSTMLGTHPALLPFFLEQASSMSLDSMTEALLKYTESRCVPVLCCCDHSVGCPCA